MLVCFIPINADSKEVLELYFQRYIRYYGYEHLYYHNKFVLVGYPEQQPTNRRKKKKRWMFWDTWKQNLHPYLEKLRRNWCAKN